MADVKFLARKKKNKARDGHKNIIRPDVHDLSRV